MGHRYNDPSRKPVAFLYLPLRSNCTVILHGMRREKYTFSTERRFSERPLRGRPLKPYYDFATLCADQANMAEAQARLCGSTMRPTAIALYIVPVEPSHAEAQPSATPLDRATTAIVELCEGADAVPQLQELGRTIRTQLRHLGRDATVEAGEPHELVEPEPAVA